MKQCPVCSDGCQSKISRNGVQIFKCTQCAMVFAHDDADRAPAKVVVTDPEFYRTTIDSFDAQVLAANRLLPGRIRAYEKLLRRKVARLLEIGCGAGAYAAAYGQLGIQFAAIEIDQGIARIAQEKTGADIRCEDFSDFVADVAYDVVFASQVVEHVREPGAFLKSVRRAAPEGLLHIDVPNHGSLSSIGRILLSRSDYGFIQPPHHMLAYTAPSMVRLLSDNGFQNIDVHARRNDDPVWGQLIASQSFGSKAVYTLGGLLGRGSLLTALGKV